MNDDGQKRAHKTAFQHSEVTIWLEGLEPLNEFWHFAKRLEAILHELETKKDQLLEDKCPKCENQLVIKHGRYGEFTACSAYPDCKFIKQKEVGVSCPKENCPGQVVERRSRRGKLFYGCSEYPNCDFTSWYMPVKEPCPECGFPVIFEKKTKRDGPHLACTQDGCKYKRMTEPEPEPEPEPVRA